MASYWLEEPCKPLPRTPVAGLPDVEIVGGGVTGCSCALVLAEAGLRVRLHEAREIAGGARGRNGGFALRGGAMPYDVARRQRGNDRARTYWGLTEDAQRAARRVLGDHLAHRSDRQPAGRGDAADLDVGVRRADVGVEP